MKNDIVVNTEELDIIKKRIEYQGNSLVNTLLDVIEETKLTKEYYDSLTGDDFREFLIDYLTKRIEYINNNYLSFATKLEEAKKSYQNYISDVKGMVGDNK